MRLENSELRAFRAVIEEGGFRRAADALHISQSAVSQAVAGLEAKLDVSLVQRGKELQLTDAGRRLFEHAVDVLRGEQRVLEDVAQLKQGKTDTPGTWVRTLGDGQRVFYTSMGYVEDFDEANFSRLVDNAVAWCLGDKALKAK